MEYAEKRPTNPPPNGITAAEIEALSAKVCAIIYFLYCLVIDICKENIQCLS